MYGELCGFFKDKVFKLNPRQQRIISDMLEYANEHSILIDDMQKNIDQWKAAGGIGILHTNAKDTIKKLKDLGL